MTLTVLLRLIILQLRQRFLTDARTFMIHAPVYLLPFFLLRAIFLHQRIVLMRQQQRLDL